MAKKKPAARKHLAAKPTANLATAPGYAGLLSDLSVLLTRARISAARVVNGLITATYYELGRRIVDFEQGGKERADYGGELLVRLAADLTKAHGRGFSRQNLQQMRAFYLGWEIRQTVSGGLQAGARPGPPDRSRTQAPPPAAPESFPLPWSHYVRLLSVGEPAARRFYEAEALRGGWSVRQLDRQVNAMLYERTALSRNKAALLEKGQVPHPGDALTPGEQIRDPYVLEFLELRDEYGEGELEEALVEHLETFLLELGDDFCFVGRQRKLRLDHKWFKVDLVFFHRRLRCLVLIDLKLGAFDHADAGQMNLYVNYAKEHWTRGGENPPVGLILCAEKGHDEARYALEGLGNQVLASTYRTTLPDERVLAAELERTRWALEHRGSSAPGDSPAG